ncbi:MAG TPA: hypothetical protein VGF75_05140 [Candidatus Saccharimonadales bacterium]|jgi:hypothetical protein
MISLPPTTEKLQFKSIGYYGLLLFIENEKGSYRYGRGWVTKAPAHYGFIFNTKGADGDEMDCYVGPDLKAGKVYIVDQMVINSTKFDEHKCMIGYQSKQAALTDYMAGHNKARSIYMGITEMTVFQFHHWLRFGNHKVPVSGVEKQDEWWR